MSDTTLLVPVDFSDCAPLLVEEAVRRARSLDATIWLLHVVVPPPGGSQPVSRLHGPPVPATHALLDEADARLDDLAGSVRAEGLRVGTRAVVGEIVPTILAEAARLDVVAILMGTHGRSGFARLMQGSVAERVRSRSLRPVIVEPTRHRPTCAAGSCSWCQTHVTPVQRRIAVDVEG